MSATTAKASDQKIFLSSTCYDLVDLRATVHQLLSSHGYTVVASELSGSNFQVFSDRDSVETCLENLRHCDAMILVFDRRYGPLIAGRGRASATHLEYQEALARGIPVITFARSAFWKEFQVYQALVKNTKNDDEIASQMHHVSTSMIEERHEFVWLFEFFDTVRETKDLTHNNWFDVFDNAVELVTLARARLQSALSIDILPIQRALNAVANAQSVAPIDLTRVTTDRALRILDRLILTEQHLAILGLYAADYDFDIGRIIARMENSTKDDLLASRFSSLIFSSKNLNYMLSNLSPKVWDAANTYARRGPAQMESITKILGGAPGANPAYMPWIEQTLTFEEPYTPPYREFTDRTTRMCAALNTIGLHGDRDHLPLVIACLGDYGEMVIGGDHEHMKWGEPTHYEYSGILIVSRAALTCLTSLTSRLDGEVELLLKEIVDSIELRVTTRMNAIRALIRLGESFSSDTIESQIVKFQAQGNDSEKFLDELIDDHAARIGGREAQATKSILGRKKVYRLWSLSIQKMADELIARKSEINWVRDFLTRRATCR